MPSFSSGYWNQLQQTSEETSQLIKVVRTRDMYVLADRHFIAFGNLFNAKDHYRHTLSHLRAFAYATRDDNDFAG